MAIFASPTRCEPPCSRSARPPPIACSAPPAPITASGANPPPRHPAQKTDPDPTFQDWHDLAPGFVEADLVAHCGGAVEGAFLCTLTVTDVATGWVACQALILRSQHTVIQAMARVRQLLPFPLLGVDTDNGSECINAGLLGWCADAQVTFTRGRTGKSNDQCVVEQKHGAVRQIVGYDRCEGDAAYQQLADLYRAVRLYAGAEATTTVECRGS